MDALERLRRVDAGLAAMARLLRTLAPASVAPQLDKFCDAVATRITSLERERDNLYALSASRFDRSELDSVIQATRKQ